MMGEMRRWITLCEAQDAMPTQLFHCTSVANLLGILKAGHFEPRSRHEIDGKMERGVSVTTSWRFAKIFADTVFDLAMDSSVDLQQTYPVILAFNIPRVPNRIARLTHHWIRGSDFSSRNRTEYFIIGEIPADVLQTIYVGSATVMQYLRHQGVVQRIRIEPELAKYVPPPSSARR